MNHEKMRDFDLLNVPLIGANLLEASAGTGKTYNIEGLFLRFVIEKALPVGEILVVTYTVAATEELRDRIRRRLRGAAAAFSQEQSSDPFLKALLAKFPDAHQRLLFQERLKAALRNYDEAAIFTIHGFCQRMLQENAFESHFFFDTELVTDERGLREEIADDFWRTNFYENIPELAGYAVSRGFNPDYFRELLDNVISRHDARIIPDIPSSPLCTIKEQVADYNAAFAGIITSWHIVRKEVCEKLNSSALNASVYGRKANGLIKAMDAFIASGGPFFPLFKDFEKFTADKIASLVKTNHTMPEHAFFHLCQTVQKRAVALIKEMDAYLLFLRVGIIRTVRKELAARKEKNNTMFFDDLLLRMRDALKEKDGEDFTRVIRVKYKAALIDEFHDTDPVQFAIFQAVFGDGETPLFLIGDPKQAIYSFRGADIFAYMKAAAGIEKRYTITENWRSEPGLVKAVNTLFSERENPFVFKYISFMPVKAASDKAYEFFTIDGRRDAPLQLWFVPAESHGESGKLLSRAKAKNIIISALATEIVRLLKCAGQGRALIGQRPLEEADIAVLVRTNREARLVQEGLRRLRIPSVLHNAGNVFDTPEAEEMERLMAAVSAPEEEPIIRAALLMDILGVTASEMEELMNDERKWAQRIEKFRLYHDLWFDKGFIEMFAVFMAGESVRSRLLAFPDGERRLTNLLHLSEILERSRGERKLSPRGLLKWFKEQRDPATHCLEEHQLRLESDERAVRIVTVHKSKGLEYPVVFCPFTWAASEIGEDVFSFHDHQGDGQLACHLGSQEDGPCRAMAARELLAENVRLLYVALTRAKNRCYFVWGRFNKAGTSAPAYLFHNVGENGDEDEECLVASVEVGFKKLNDEEMYRRMEEIVLAAEGEIALREVTAPARETLLPRYETTEKLTFREFSGRIDRYWRVVSFSSLVSERQHNAELPDYDSDFAGEAPSLSSLPALVFSRDASFPEAEKACDIFSFPRGAGAGTLLHDILEHFDFTEKSEDAARILISQKLHIHGFDPMWEDVILTLLRKVADIPLFPFNTFYPPLEKGGWEDFHKNGSDSTHESFALSAVSNSERLNEVEFYFPLHRLAPEDLKSVFSPVYEGMHQIPPYPFLPKGGWGDFLINISGLNFNPARGFMKGFIDMVFCYAGKYYLVDWKSNFLGRQIADYGQALLADAMAGNLYILQYHIYVLALHQYLTLRLPDYRYKEHMGGVYYIFLRGIEPALGPEYGIYRARPDERLVAAMAEKLIAVN
jgi:exodeoxyribonuclease V beta subunit